MSTPPEERQMFSDYEEPGIGLGAFLLSMNTMLMLEKKGVLTPEETKEILAQALLNLETHETQAGPKGLEAAKAARVLLEQFGVLLARSSSMR
jgi:hypothetical protein